VCDARKAQKRTAAGFKKIHLKVDIYEEDFDDSNDNFGGIFYTGAGNAAKGRMVNNRHASVKMLGV